MDRNARWVLIAAGAVVGACVLLCAAVGLGVRYAPDLYIWFKSRDSLKVGSPAPDFSLPSLEGQTVRLSQYRGQPVLLIFAASWCPACRAEAPAVQSLHLSHPELAVLLVDSNEDATIVRGFARDFGMTHPVLLDADGKIARQYRIFAFPTACFIDSDGIIRGLVIGAISAQVLDERLPLIGVEP